MSGGVPSGLNDEDDEESMFNQGSLNGMSSNSNSRARMLAQQRDIQLKKRMSAVQAGGNLCLCQLFIRWVA
jgi:hypothetical protein